MTEENYQLLLVRKITQNRLSSEELSLLKQYQEVLDPEGELEKNLRLAWDSSTEAVQGKPSSRMADKVADRIYLEKAKKYRNVGLFTKIAATIILIISISLYLQKGGHKDAEWATFTASTGQLGKLTLPDGTKITAMPGTSILYPLAFTTDQRLIKISGTAYLSVTRDPERPFIVSAGPTTTTVLGTSFSVHYDSLAQSGRVAVKEGKVKVETAFQSTFLKDMEVIEISHHDQTTRMDKLKDLRDFDWTQGLLTYEDTPIHEILNQLSKWYGVTITSSQAENCVFTGSFRAENLQVILLNIAESNHLKIDKIAKNHYVLTGKGC
ncbi:FecR family protein [Anditalea andensis]|uniref:FecR protein domain-containing protein n=1 Tax=Anditalea andensis TaxID=1048983 RepID=A0A074L054_9BACT|nr:FecR domain-containing protein [Anditalea andensis]KEO75596.1 hypothetical protein EL17_00445 [Anditalea andensis]